MPERSSIPIFVTATQTRIQYNNFFWILAILSSGLSLCDNGRGTSTNSYISPIPLLTTSVAEISINNYLLIGDTWLQVESGPVSVLSGGLDVHIWRKNHTFQYFLKDKYSLCQVVLPTVCYLWGSYHGCYSLVFKLIICVCHASWTTL